MCFEKFKILNKIVALQAKILKFLVKKGLMLVMKFCAKFAENSLYLRGKERFSKKCIFMTFIRVRGL